MRTSALALGCLLATGPSAWAASPEVWKHWSDGQAELSGYRLTQPRYGQLRSGTVVLIYVTEPFSRSARVKADPGRHPDSDVETVLKLNVVKDFPTGIYDYNVMTSAFLALEPKGGRPAELLKLSFSSQEWCGHVYEELTLEPTVVERLYRSYFDGENTSGPLPRPPGALTTEELLFRVRGLPEPLIAPGETKVVSLLGSVERARFLHRPLGFAEARISRSKAATPKTVPAGTFSVDLYTVVSGDETYVYAVERDFPHRLVAFEGPDGERLELTGSRRLPYWKLHDNGGEVHRRELGLP